MICVSVIIPVYNGEKYIDKSIHSIEKTKFNNFEIIVINDGSQDNTSKILQELSKKYKNLRIIETENNGVSKARNLGIQVAQGKYVTFVDADDMINENYFECLVNRIEESDLLIFNYSCLGEERQVQKLDDGYGKYSIDEFDDKFMLYFNHEMLNSPVNKMYMRETIIKYNVLFPENLSLGEDLIFNLNYLRHVHQITVIEDVLYNYNYVSNSLSNRIRSDYLDIQKRLIRELEDYLIDMNRYSDYNKQLLEQYRIQTIVSFTQDVFQKHLIFEQKKQFFKLIIDELDINIKMNRINGIQNKCILVLLKYRSFYGMVLLFKIKKILKVFLNHFIKGEIR